MCFNTLIKSNVMNVKSIFFLSSLLLLATLCKADWVSLNKQASTPSPPEVTLLSDDQNSTVVRIDISGFEIKELSTDSKQYQKVDLLNDIFTTEPGFPELPYIAKVLAIPDDAVATVEILETGEVQTFADISLPPARESWIEGTPETPFLENYAIYGLNKSYPANFAQMDQPSVFRDFRISRLSVFPMRYNSAKKQLEVISSITVRINYGKGEVVNPKTSPKRPISPSFGKLYDSFIFNYQSVLEKSFGGKEDAGELMLCIMPDDFYDSFQPYADWKRKSGVDIHITKFSDIGANADDEVIIKNHIEDTYLNWDVPPTYVLFVGDGGVFPYTYSGSYVSENYFVELEGGDYFPEMMLGRITVWSDYALQVMLHKLMIYEQTPDTTDTDWFKKGVCCSNDAYLSQVTTKEFAAERMLVDGEFIQVDEMMSDPGCTYSVQDVIAAINEGRSYLNYRGEGWSSGWWASCTPMGVGDIPSINNGNKFTFVTSIGCGVAMFATGNCFGEAWMEAGSLSDPKGACAFIGPAGNTHTTYNNKIDKGIYQGMFPEGMDTPGQALIRGRLYMYNVFGNTSSVAYHYRIYLTLGDPSIHIWKDFPKAITVLYPATIPIGNNTVEFTVTHTENNQVVPNAVVAVTNEDFFYAGTTDESGKIYIDLYTEELDTFDITVRGGNVYTTQDILPVIPATGPYVIKDSYTINDTEGGNGNGLLDYGESNLLSITMANVGIVQANDVSVSISTESPYVTLTDSTADYGNIAAGSTIVIDDGFAYSVAENIPDLESVSFEVVATSGSLSWTSYINITAHAPVLEYAELFITDPLGNNDGTFDPGETVELNIIIENSGSSSAINCIGELSIIDPYITVEIDTASFGEIPGGLTSLAIFTASAAPNTPSGHPAEFILTVTADLSIGCTGEPSVYVGQIPVLILDLAESSNSAPEMEVALSTLDLTFETLSDFPEDLNLYSIIFVCLGSFPDNYELNSSEGDQLAEYLNNGGSLYMEGGETWDWDLQTTVHPMFSLNGSSGGVSSMYQVIGIPDTFTEGMSFSYSGGSYWIDQIEPVGTAVKIFESSSQDGVGVANDAGDYRTIGISYEFGGLVDGEEPSTKEELMSAYLEYLGFPMELQSYFFSSATNVCTVEIVEFYDSSFGNPVSWEWEFEGGSPPTSTFHSPQVVYFDPGVFDVTLTVSDGVEFSTLTLEDYMVVIPSPEIPPTPEGEDEVCTNITPASAYTITSVNYANTYQWEINPVEAGFIAGNDTIAYVQWTTNYVGTATITVCGVNEECGEGEFSEGFDVECIICTGIGEYGNAEDIHLFPNPTTGMVTIDFNNYICPNEVIVVNTLKDVVYSKSIKTLPGKNLRIDLSDLTKGVYFIRIKFENFELTEKLVLW